MGNDNEILKNGTRVTTAQDWWKSHGVNKATVVGYDDGNYHLTFDGCDCKMQAMNNGGHSCQLFSITWITVLEDETRKVQETTNKNAASLADWFGGQDEDD